MAEGSPEFRYDAEFGNQLGDTKEKLLQEMKLDPMISGSKLSEKLGISTTAVEKNIRQLREAGIVYRIGSTQGYWEAAEQAFVSN